MQVLEVSKFIQRELFQVSTYIKDTSGTLRLHYESDSILLMQCATNGSLIREDANE